MKKYDMIWSELGLKPMRIHRHGPIRVCDLASRRITTVTLWVNLQRRVSMIACNR